MEKCEEMSSFVRHEDLAGQLSAAVVLGLQLPLLQQITPGVNLVRTVGFHTRPEERREEIRIYLMEFKRWKLSSLGRILSRPPRVTEFSAETGQSNWHFFADIKFTEMRGKFVSILKPSSFLLRRVLYQKFHTSILSVWGFDNLPPSVVAGISLCIPDL